MPVEASQPKGDEIPFEEQREKYLKAGKIAAEVREKIAHPMVKPGLKVLDLCTKIEDAIRAQGGEIAFPCNVSINEIAAHYSSPLGDETVIQEDDLVKVDFGVHIDGFIADQAFSIAFTDAHASLIKAAHDSCEAAISMIKAGVKTNAIGQIVEGVIKKAGFASIRELSGHQLSQYELHGGLNLPNIALPVGKPLEANQIFAVETFASTGSGHVHNRPTIQIYSLQPQVRAPLRFSGARHALGIISKEFKTLPFTERWLAKGMNPAIVPLAMRELTRSGIVYPYPVLAEDKGAFVAQEEHTVIVTASGCEVTTR